MCDINFKDKYVVGGFIPSPHDERDYKLNQLVKKAVKLPDEYINTTPLKILDQGSSSMCVGCAIAQAKHIIEYDQNKDIKMFSPAYIYGNRENGNYSGEGMIVREALKSLTDNGICHYDYLEGFYSYPEAKRKYESNKKMLDVKAYPYRISSYYRLNTMEEIKTAIYTLGCAMVAYDVYECMYNPDKEGVIHFDSDNKGNSFGGHQVLAIGYNKTGLIICNSWGEAYGKNGLITIPYDYTPSESWAITDEILDQEVQELYGKKDCFIKIAATVIRNRLIERYYRVLNFIYDRIGRQKEKYGF